MEGLITTLHKKDEPKGRPIIIARHGQTKLNAEDKIRAWIDVPLDEVGIEQAQDLGIAMRDSNLEADGIFLPICCAASKRLWRYPN
jgi:broad specificity phosphatase PhoE